MTMSQFLAEALRIRPTLEAWVEKERAEKGIGFVVFIESHILLHSDIMELPLAYISLPELEAIVIKEGGNLSDPKLLTFIETIHHPGEVQIYIAHDISNTDDHLPVRVPLLMN